MPDKTKFIKDAARITAIVLFTAVAGLFISSCTVGSGPQTGPPGPVAPYVAAGVATACAASTGPEECFRAALEDRVFDRSTLAADKLKTLRAKYPTTLWAKRAAFLLGLYSLKEDRPGAAAYFREALGLTEIQDYGLLYLARSYRKADRLEDALRTYGSLIEKNPGSPVIPEALYERGLTLGADGRTADALAAMEGFMAANPKSPLQARALVKAATLAMELNEPERASTLARETLIRYPANESAVEAAGILSELEEKGVDIAEFSAKERLLRGNALLRASRFKDALKEFLEVKENGGKEYSRRASMPYILTLFRLRRYGEAQTNIEALLKGHKSTPAEERKLLSLLSVAAVRQGGETLLLKTGKRLLKRFPGSPEAAGVLMMTGQFYEGRGDTDRAFRAYGRILRTFKKTGFAATALWRVGWMEYRLGRYKEAHRTLGSYGARSLGAREETKFIYWNGRSLEKAGRITEAAREYEKACAGRSPSYYCIRAGERLEGLAPGLFKGAVAVSPRVMEAGLSEYERAGLDRFQAEPFADRHYLAARELLTLGLTDEAAGEFALFEKTNPPVRAALLEIMRLFYLAGDYYHAINIYGRYFPILNDNGAAAGLLEIAFPMKAVEYIEEKELAGPVDPLLVAAVMREESSFRADTVSRTGAVGLMQIMPDTAEFIAMKSGVKSFAIEDLSDPDTNIRFGSWYLSYLSARFGHDVILTIAGYNAGPSAVKRWTKELPGDPDEFIESIPYPETRNYTKKVLKSYTVYRELSGLKSRQRLLSMDERAY